MIKAGGRETVTAISELVNLIIFEEKIPEDWKDSFIINCYKGKGDATDRGIITYSLVLCLGAVLQM